MNIVASVLLIGLSLIATQFFCFLAQGTRLMDTPNERSLHTIPKVRGAGLVFIGLFLICLPIIGYGSHTSFNEIALLFTSSLLIAAISFCDDLFTLSARPRFLVQCLVACMLSLLMPPETLNFVLFSISNKYAVVGLICFCVLWAINHFNFMDGLDGFCGSQALFLFFAYALLFNECGALFYQTLCCLLIFGLVGFLAFNFPPAKLFMGDVGSATLGFISFYMALVAQQKYQIPILYWFILNGLFLFDATITLLRRIYKKEQWFAAHRKHAYQRLKQYGLNTRLILLGQLCINMLLFACVLIIQRYGVPPGLLMVFSMTFLALIYGIVEKLHPMTHS